MLCSVGLCLLKQAFHVQRSCADHCFVFRKDTCKMEIKVSKKTGLTCSERCFPSGENKAWLRFLKCLLDIPRPLPWRPLLTPPTVSHYQEARVTRKSKLSLLGCRKIISYKLSMWAEPVLTGSGRRGTEAEGFFHRFPWSTCWVLLQRYKILESWNDDVYLTTDIWWCVHLLSTAWQYFC